MNTKSFLSLFLAVFLTLIIGCSATKDYPKFDQVLVYDHPFDYTYLKTLEALTTFPNWVLEETDKNKGLVVVRNTEYGHVFDHDKWTVRFNVVSLGRNKTSVSIDPLTQQNEKGGELLKRIDHVIMMASSVQGEKRAIQLS